ncbi:MAG: DUF2207 domain-containing protein [Planctomycetota bacterium]|jgi:hypothetical protein
MRVFAEHPETLVALAGLAVLAVLFAVAWSMRGRAKPGRSVQPRTEPPEGLTASGARFLRLQAYDATCLTAALLDLESHDAIGIERTDGRYRITPEGTPGAVPGPEGEMARALFDAETAVEIGGGGPSQRLLAAAAVLSAGLERRFRESHLRARGGLVAAVLVTGLVVLGTIAYAVERDQWDFVALSAGAAVLMLCSFGLGRHAARRLAVGESRTFLQLGLSIVLVVGAGLLVGEAHEQGPIVFPFALAGIGYLIFKADVLLTPSDEARAALDQIEGYLLHLKQGEDPLGSWERMFRSGLPYAVAAGIERSWIERLDIARGVTESSYDVSFAVGLDEAVRKATAG